MSQRFTVTAERAGKWWALESSNGAVSQVRALAQAEDEMREAIAFLADIPESEVEIELQVITPTEYQALTAEAEQYRRQADELSARASEVTRRAARELTRTMSVRDAGRVMGVSHQRVQQLVKS